MGHALGNNYGKFYSFQSKPVLLDLQFTVDATQAVGVSSIKGQGVSQIFMHSTAATPSGPNPIAGIALIKLAYNYKQYFCGPWNAQPPTTGSDLAINGSALTLGTPYQITSVGVGAKGAVTIEPVADSSGSLASTWFSLYDGYGNTFIIYFVVSGVGSRPDLGVEDAYGTQGLHYVQQSIATNDTAATIGAALAVTIAALPSGISGVFSFTAAGTTTVTATSTKNSPVAGPPSDGTAGTGFAFAMTVYSTNLQDWQGVGLKPGIEPAVGDVFIAIATGYTTGGSSTGLVKALAISNVAAINVLGDTNLSLSPIPMSGSPNSGGWVIINFVDFAGALVAPTAGTKFYIQMLLEFATPVGGNNE